GEAMSVKIEHGADDDDPTFEMNDAGMHVLGPNKMGESEVVMVHSNIEEPTPTAFAKVHTLDARLDAESGVATPEASPTDEMPNTVLQITSANVGMVMATQFRAPAESTGTVPIPFKGRVADNTSTTNVDETAPGKMVRGTFNGAMGTYQCVVTTDCTVTANAKGVVSAVSNDNDWIFMPDDGVMVNVDDDVYYYYGFWVKKTETEEDGLTYNAVQTFAGGHGDAISDVTTGIVEGEAKYEGGAAGVYGHKSFNADGSENVVSSGTFTAKASLTAYFGSTSAEVGTAFHNTLRGEITDFNLSGGEAQKWKVDLTRTTLTGSGVSNPGTAEGATLWNAVFYSPGKDATPDDDSTSDVTPPQVVVGEFNADFPNDNGNVAGAFGAELVKE
ncbi:MAG: hypothetical protein OXG62_04135, partial [Nitrospinae bacterium]|nr:hypothetical protein [Nitrospinota bacterium]